MKAVIRLLRIGMVLKAAFVALVFFSYALWLTSGQSSIWAKEGASSSNVTRSDRVNIDALDINERIKVILKARLRKIKERERALQQKERDLALIKEEIEKRIKTLKDLEASLKGPLATAKKANEERFMHLVGVYSSMEPQRAAMLLEKMDEETVVKLFSSMKSKKVAKILSYMDTDKAARISSRLSRPNL